MTPFERKTLINELRSRKTWHLYEAIVFVQNTRTTWSNATKCLLDELVRDGIATSSGDIYKYVENA